MQRVLAGRADRRTSPRTRIAPAIAALLALAVHVSYVAAAAPATESDPSPLARLDALLSVAGRPARPPDLGALMDSPDRRVRTRAARLASRNPADEDVAPMATLLCIATPAELRAVVEGAAPPLPDSWAGVCSALYADGGRERAPFAIELTGLLSPAAAETVLLGFLDASPARADLTADVLGGLADISSERSTAALSSWLNAPDRDSAAAAYHAVDALRSRLLAEGRIEECLNVLRAARRSRPNDLELLLHECMVEGVYLGRAAPALIRLERRFREFEAEPPGAAARDAAELALAGAVVRWFAGDADGSARQLDLALARIGRPSPHQRLAATTRARILLVASVLERLDRGASERARALVSSADRAASLEERYCRFDDALDGPFGAINLLGLLRRRGHEATTLDWFALADGVLADPAGRSAIGIVLDTADAPAAGTDAAAVASERIRSWLPCRRAWAEYEAGRLEEASRVARRVVAPLEKSDLWNNRLLAAECALLLGHARARAGDTEGANDAYRRADRSFDELGEEGLRYQLEEQKGRFLDGAAPQRPHHGERRAQALIGLGEVRLRLEGDGAGAAARFREAYDAAPGVTTIRLRYVATLAEREDPARAARLLDGTPGRAGLLVGLAELAAALGREDEARRLLERHLAWNALSEARAEQERRWFALLPTANGGSGD